MEKCVKIPHFNFLLMCRYLWSFLYYSDNQYVIMYNNFFFFFGIKVGNYINRKIKIVTKYSRQ